MKIMIAASSQFACRPLVAGGVGAAVGVAAERERQEDKQKEEESARQSNRNRNESARVRALRPNHRVIARLLATRELASQSRPSFSA